jgi:AraC family transcriptional regulator, arabinose operon regulatory protein
MVIRNHPTAELRCGLFEFPHPMQQRSFVTPQLACCWIQRGEGELHLDGVVHPLRSGDVFQRLPGRCHDIIMRTSGSWLFTAIPAPALALLTSIAPRSAGLPVLSIGADAQFAARWRQAVRLLASCPDDDRAPATATLFALVAEVHHRAVRRVRDDWAVRACALLDADLRRPLPEIARRMGLQPASFRARFGTAMGLSPQAWRIRQRIAQAQELLADPTLPLEQIADRLGYPDLPTFAKQFRSVAGLPPGRWRRTMG